MIIENDTTVVKLTSYEIAVLCHALHDGTTTMDPTAKEKANEMYNRFVTEGKSDGKTN